MIVYHAKNPPLISELWRWHRRSASLQLPPERRAASSFLAGQKTRASWTQRRRAGYAEYPRAIRVSRAVGRESLYPYPLLRYTCSRAQFPKSPGTGHRDLRQHADHEVAEKVRSMIFSPTRCAASHSMQGRGFNPHKASSATSIQQWLSESDWRCCQCLGTLSMIARLALAAQTPLGRSRKSRTWPCPGYQVAWSNATGGRFARRLPIACRRATGQCHASTIFSGYPLPTSNSRAMSRPV